MVSSLGISFSVVTLNSSPGLYQGLSVLLQRQRLTWVEKMEGVVKQNFVHKPDTHNLTYSYERVATTHWTSTMFLKLDSIELRFRFQQSSKVKIFLKSTPGIRSCIIELTSSS